MCDDCDKNDVRPANTTTMQIRSVLIFVYVVHHSWPTFVLLVERQRERERERVIYTKGDGARSPIQRCLRYRVISEALRFRGFNPSLASASLRRCLSSLFFSAKFVNSCIGTNRATEQTANSNFSQRGTKHQPTRCGEGPTVREPGGREDRKRSRTKGEKRR